jgi:hypothetical protein
VADIVWAVKVILDFGHREFFKWNISAVQNDMPCSGSRKGATDTQVAMVKVGGEVSNGLI